MMNKPISIALFILLSVSVLFAQTTEITYQGQLQSSSALASGNFDFEFLLFDAGGAQIGSTITRNGVVVANGIFSVNLDFGSSFPGANRFLEIRVRQSGGGAFTTLSPRQSVTSAPYSVKSLSADNAANATNATNAVNATNLTGNLTGDVTGTQGATVVTTVGGQTAANVGGAAQSVNAATPNNTPNTLVRRDASGNFIAGTITGNLIGNASMATNATNATTATNATQLGGVAASQYLQTNGNGSGLTNLNAGSITTGTLTNARLGLIPTANIADSAVTAPKIASGQVVKSLNTLKDDVTLAAGSNITITPAGNTLTIASTGGGGNAILNQTTQQAGANFNISGNGTAGGTLSANIVNATTQYNIRGSRLLSASGLLDTNLFAGVGAGAANPTGCCNTFFGSSAGRDTTSGGSNSFFGNGAGRENTLGLGNAFFGSSAGGDNANGNQNAFFGNIAGLSNTLGEENSFFGIGAGFYNLVGSSNTMVGARAGGVASNLTNATAIGARAQVDQSNALVLGSIAGVNGATTSVNVGIGTTTPLATLDTRGSMLVSGNVGIGTTAPLSKLDIAATGDGAELLRFSTERPWSFRQVRTGASAGLQLRSTSGLKMFEITALGGANVATFVADDASPRVGIGTTTPTERLSVNGNMTVFGFIQLGGPGFGGESPLCRNVSTQQIAFCGSSLSYKKDLEPFVGGLEILNRLNPITFTWKASGTRDLGLGAEDVAKVEPLLVTHNDKGEVEGVKYDRVGVVLVNAVKEQQAQIEAQERRNDDQQKQIEQQRKVIELLTKAVCSMNPKADICPQN